MALHEIWFIPAFPLLAGESPQQAAQSVLRFGKAQIGIRRLSEGTHEDIPFKSNLGARRRVILEVKDGEGELLIEPLRSNPSDFMGIIIDSKGKETRIKGPIRRSIGPRMDQVKEFGIVAEGEYGFPFLEALIYYLPDASQDEL